MKEPLIKELHHLGITEILPCDEISPRKVAIFRLVHLKKIFDDCSVVCLFLEHSLDRQAELMKAVTGWETGAVELIRVAERVMTVARLFNIKEGFSASDDVLPERFFQPKTDGVLARKPPFDRADMEKAKSYYYRLMGWDEKGVPLPEKVEELYIE
jgi:aldehyde:ferredoxin oxidoreductase